MNTDIRLSVGFWEHPKTFRLIKRLGLKGVRSLQKLWCWCAQNRPDGILDGFECDEIEFVADWRGKKCVFTDACKEIGWLDETESGYALHEWADYNPYQAQAATREEARRERARYAANARWGKENATCSNDANAYAKTDASICSSNAQGCSSNATSNAQAYAWECLPVPIPVPVPEEIKESFCAEPCSSTQSGPAKIPETVLPEKDPVITLPLNTGPEYPVMPEKVSEWQRLYPAVDVFQQLRNMRGWLLENKSRRKTASGIGRFINSWLAREQDKGPRASPEKPETRHVKTFEELEVERVAKMREKARLYDEAKERGEAV